MQTMVLVGVLGFVAGLLAAMAIGHKMLGAAVRKARFAGFCTKTLAEACQEVLSEAFYKKVMKLYSARMVRFGGEEAR